MGKIHLCTSEYCQNWGRLEDVTKIITKDVNSMVLIKSLRFEMRLEIVDQSKIKFYFVLPCVVGKTVGSSWDKSVTTNICICASVCIFRLKYYIWQLVWGW